MSDTNRDPQSGSVFAYILGAIFLMGVLILTLTGGPEKSAITAQLDEQMSVFVSDIRLAEGGVNDCVLQYAAPADVDGDNDTDTTDNPNAPFPLYGDSSSGAAGDELADIVCPGKKGRPVVFGNKAGRGFRLLNDANFDTIYFNTSAEGAFIRITRAAADPVWTEVLSRLDDKFSECKAADVTAGGTCANGCFYYWLSRRGTSTIGTSGDESACP